MPVTSTSTARLDGLRVPRRRRSAPTGERDCRCSQGDGITLRELRLSDAASLLALLTTEEVTRFISPPPTTIEGFERFIQWAQREREAGRYRLLRRRAGWIRHGGRPLPGSAARSLIRHGGVGICDSARRSGARASSWQAPSWLSTLRSK